MFDFIDESPFDETFARYFFKQLMEGLNYCHKAGIAHRDIKLENLYIDHKYILKIADFGFATNLVGKGGDGWLITKCGSKTYRAPEINTKDMKYEGKKIDLFATGVVLFTLVCGTYPFSHAS